ncbi:hypothetical protein M413DRAFT_447140 [Hebeloma cylindrosporum]|uniref:RING-type domain-containing protein n=1 Tax=Hebeloma cylindrosporum TaxID=76867 RepID=A0A0C2YF72_HEBCY|nr:hypothetical protein M413DRAFT_447140 [Hebeloma cylindrosporum h7]
MASCRICLEDTKKPVALPCGHIFCGDCIVKTVQAVKPYTHLQPCPICRAIYNIAPINLNVVPANLRPFITPSIRRVYIDPSTSQGNGNDTPDVNEQQRPAVAAGSSSRTAIMTSSSSASSELARLRAENIALRNNCALWRKRAEMHGAANLGLLNFARVVRDQASHLARERDELQTRCHSLKRKVENYEMARCSESAMVEAFLQGRSEIQNSGSPDPGSLLFAPPFQYFPDQDQGSSGQRLMSEVALSSPAEPPSSTGSDFNRPRKRAKTDDSNEPAFTRRTTPVSVSENLARGSGKAQPSIGHGEPLTP